MNQRVLQCQVANQIHLCDKQPNPTICPTIAHSCTKTDSTVCYGGERGLIGRLEGVIGIHFSLSLVSPTTAKGSFLTCSSSLVSTNLKRQRGCNSSFGGGGIASGTSDPPPIPYIPLALFYSAPILPPPTHYTHLLPITPTLLTSNVGQPPL